LSEGIRIAILAPAIFDRRILAIEMQTVGMVVNGSSGKDLIILLIVKLA